ncbi:MAG: indolepyruvate ferredoxin oxidoreductase subunit alpha [Firmicutes bacterium]|nr:indolepyruvate ferredoxin oxidoreductase subunit alpha [Bacillota bacterium]
MLELLMGNEAIAAGALAAGVRVVSGYPGTPSTEVLETIAKRNPGFVHVEWSVNEKAALEVAAGAAYSGARALVTMKQVGLNVASDPLMSLNYVGVKGGMVVFVADDPGPISSQTEQDTRHFGKFAKIPVFDPSSPEDAYEMIQDAFNWSERCGMPVIFRATTRVCHACASVDIEVPGEGRPVSGFVKSSDFVIFPKLSYENKKKLEAREVLLSDSFSNYKYNAISGNGSVGIACGGVSAAYTAEALEDLEDSFRVFRVATPFPFPEKKAEEFLQGLERVIVFEELDPVIEDALIYLCGKKHINVEILGKRTGTVPNAGELSAVTVRNILAEVCGTAPWPGAEAPDSLPELPVRPPVLCAGCPHRASFYAVKKAMEGKRAVFCGDIGCYTLGNAAPLNMVDTCLCMGAGITVAQGIGHGEPGSVNFGFIGDSTFFASGITGVINAVYNKSDIIAVILDNSTTAMTGHQPHPGIGKTVMGEKAEAISISAVLKAVGVKTVLEVNPLDHEAAVSAVRQAAEQKGVRAIIFRSPCIAKEKSKKRCSVETESCIGCRKCIRELGCPAIFMEAGKAKIDKGLCTGCGLCASVCPKQCMKEVEA